MKVIVSIPTDEQGGKLWIKDLETIKDKVFVKSKTSYNDMPFVQTELISMEGNLAICGDDGTVLYRFSKLWLDKLK